MGAQLRIPLSTTMKKNIDAILNQDYELGENYQNSGLKITERPFTGILDIECVFHGSNPDTGNDYTFEPYQINKIVIDQKFSEAYMDEISMVLTLLPKQLMDMLDYYRSLKCNLIMRHRDPKGSYIEYDDAVFDREYRVVMKDKELRKRLSKKALLPDTEYEKDSNTQQQLFDNIEVQLIEDKSYLLRKKKFNFILRNVKMKDVILYLAQCCEVKKISLVDPDNVEVYENFVIPPQHTFSSAMEFMQEYYGIYNKGLTYYYTDEVLYVYPTYETNPTTTPETAHFYFAGEDAVAGTELYHAFSDDIAHIVLASAPTTKDLVDGGVENFGNTIMFQHADRIIDLYTSIGEGKDGQESRMGMGQLDIKEPNTSIFAPKDDDFGMSEDAYNIRFQFTNNMYKEKSKMYMYMREMLGAKWQNAEPMIIKPGYLLHYHYDGEDTARRTEEGDDVEYADTAEYMTRDGVCEQATYEIKPVQGGKLDTKQFYACTATIILSLEYEPAKPDKSVSKGTAAMATKGDTAFKAGADIKSTASSAASTATTAAAATSFFNL